MLLRQYFNQFYQNHIIVSEILYSEHKWTIGQEKIIVESLAR